MLHLFLTILRQSGAWYNRNRRIIGALIMREITTRYGRDNIGFLWIIAEPIIFATGVSLMWSQIHPPYENGIALTPFIITGYMPLILLRQTVGYTVGAVKQNNSLLFHRSITPLHLILSRCLVEFIGVTLAFITIVSVYIFLGIMSFPGSLSDFGIIVQGWLLLAWVSIGLAFIMVGIAEIFEVAEKFISIITYVAIPVSGFFLMAVDMPPRARAIAMKLPLIHAFEMIRRGFFGPGIATIYNAQYATYCAAALTLFGLLVVRFVRDRVEVD